MEITQETRLESYFLAPRQNRYRMILDVLEGQEMTANEIRKALGFSDLNAVRPRLTELKDKGVIEAIGKKFDRETGRRVAVFHMVEGVD